MRSVGSEDELVWVMAHEAGHLLFGHAHKIRNALGYQLVGAAEGLQQGGRVATSVGNSRTEGGDELQIETRQSSEDVRRSPPGAVYCHVPTA